MPPGRAIPLGLVVVAFGGCIGTASSTGTSPTATPMAVIGQEYSRAADKVNTTLSAIDARLSSDRKALDPCKADFAQWAKAETDFTTAFQSMKLPSSMEADQRALLRIEWQRISFLVDASKATSLDQVNTDFDELTALNNNFDDDIVHIRFDIGLPTAPRASA